LVGEAGDGEGEGIEGGRAGAAWLLLVHQLPAKPAYLRVKVWRRLQGLGAVAIKGSVYALPAGEQAREDLHWLLAEIVEGGGEAMVCEARLIDGLSDREVRALFDRARDEDYGALARELRALDESLGQAPDPDRRREARAQLRRLRRQFEQVAAVDFFGADGREGVEGLLAGLEARVAEEGAGRGTAPAPGPADAPRGRVWVTRAGVQVDRIASAWLIRRFIDPEARFEFVSPRGRAPRPGELRFDMFEAEFTHRGDRCTFEVLLDDFGLSDPGLRAIAEIVHDIDLKDGKFGREEASGLASLLSGIAAATGDDRERIRRGEAVFEDLHAFFRRGRK
jgi:hypothetical protein